VTILPGLTDLRGNAALEGFRTVFATGNSIPMGVVRGVVGLALKGEALRIPRERKFFAREDFGDDGVGGGIAPEDEVLAVEVGGGDRGIVFYDQFAAENIAPHFCRVGEFGGDFLGALKASLLD
jgi:hypothetical protein